MESIVQLATDLSLLVSTSFNPSLNWFQLSSFRKRRVEKDSAFSIPLQPTAFCNI